MLASLTVAGCLAISSAATRITAADVAPAVPAFAALPPATELTLAPVPGVVRTFHLLDLKNLFTKFGLPGEPDGDVCVQRAVAPLTVERLLEGMRRIFPKAQIEIAEFSRQPAPEGEVEFAISGLHYSEPLALWTGSIRYGKDQRFSIWARVRIRETISRVVAVSDLKAGQPIEAAQLRLETREAFPQRNVFAERPEEAAGKCPRVAIRAGSDLRTALLEPAKEVLRGDTVRVVVESGGAQLHFDGQAETSGAIGQSVLIRNPLSQKQFRAVVEAKNQVRIKP